MPFEGPIYASIPRFGLLLLRSTALKGTFGVLNVLVALFRGSGFNVKVRSVRTRSGH